MTGNRRGNCYVASEALYHIIGGKQAGWTPMVMRVAKGETHWFLRHASGMILDPSVKQFGTRTPQYHRARPCGFLTREPSLRGRDLMDRLTYQDTGK